MLLFILIKVIQSTKDYNFDYEGYKMVIYITNNVQKPSIGNSPFPSKIKEENYYSTMNYNDLRERRT